MSSVDGRLLPSRWTAPFGCSMSDCVKEYAAIGRELGTDAWMFGLATAQESLLPYKFVCKKTEYAIPRKPYIDITSRESERLFIVSDPEGKIFYHTTSVRGDNIVAIIGENVPDEYLQHLQSAHISYVFGGKDGYDMATALDVLSDIFGVKVVSLQGGGIIDGAMLAAGLINELSLVMYPGIDGLTTAPSIFEYLGASDEFPAAGQSLELLSADVRNHGVVWLRYKFHKNQSV